MNKDDGRLYYEAQLEAYRALLGSMDRQARSAWFFVVDESEILSFVVGPGETVEAASARHGIKLAAMADALEACAEPDVPSAQVADLRRLAARHGYIFE